MWQLLEERRNGAKEKEPRTGNTNRPPWLPLYSPAANKQLGYIESGMDGEAGTWHILVACSHGGRDAKRIFVKRESQI